MSFAVFRLRIRLPYLLIVGTTLAAMLPAAGCAFVSDKGFPPTAPIITEPAPASAHESLAALMASSAPARDMLALTTSLRGIEAPAVAQKIATKYKLGDSDHFWYKDLGNGENRRIEAILKYRSDNINMWVEAGARIDEEEIGYAANIIEVNILPANRALFGQEWSPGVDGDKRINILHLREIGGVGAAYYWSGDEYVTAVNPFSNQREIIYVSLEQAELGSNKYYGAIAHELQHLIQWHNDRNEDAWLNEGLGELAAEINGFGTGRAANFGIRTDIQLTTLSQEPDVIGDHYAAAGLFSLYFRDRFGDEGIKRLAAYAENGISGINQVLEGLEPGLTFETLFAEWLAANYLLSIGRSEGINIYQNMETIPLEVEELSRLPAEILSDVNQFGADYYYLQGNEPATLWFTGTQQVPLNDAQPHSGDYYWISSPADESDMTLTREFDLSEVGRATLSFWTWYEIEDGWDYGYVSVSTDQGLTWRLLETESSTTSNPEGNSLGPGFTGRSGGGTKSVWQKETADLSPYGGKHILLRFQYVTDGAVHEQGFLIDDIAIRELGFKDTVEVDANGWEASGFVRSSQMLPQQFILQQILVSDAEIKVERLILDENQSGKWLIPLNSQDNEVILVIAGATPFTRQKASYSFRIAQ